MIRALTAVTGLLSALASAAPCPVRTAWPTTAWPSRVDQVATARATQIAALEQYAFTLTGADAERRGIRTDGVVIVQGGELVYERYARGFDAGKRHLSWSVSKSFTSALAGIAVQRGQLTLTESICTKLTWASGEACQVRVVDLLEMASGLQWAETYEGRSNQASSVLAMLYGVGRGNAARFVLSHPFRDPPGTTWSYSSGDTNVLAAVLDAVFKPELGNDYPWTLLFDPIGITSATWERDASGGLIGSSYLYATPRDLAKFGFFALNDGCWDARLRILPEGWMAESTAVAAPFRLNPLGETDSYGRQWWLNQPVPEQGLAAPWPDVPQDAFAARGHWGQSITIIPSLDLVIVRTADDREPAFDFNEFLRLAIEVGRP